MKVHELKTLNFSEALARLEEKAITTKGEFNNIKSRTEQKQETRDLAEKLEQEQLAIDTKMAALRHQKSMELSGRNDTIMKEVIDALDNISFSIQKMLRLL